MDTSATGLHLPDSSAQRAKDKLEALVKKHGFKVASLLASSAFSLRSRVLKWIMRLPGCDMERGLRQKPNVHHTRSAVPSPTLSRCTKHRSSQSVPGLIEQRIALGRVDEAAQVCPLLACYSCGLAAIFGGDAAIFGGGAAICGGDDVVFGVGCWGAAVQGVRARHHALQACLSPP
eukprot:1043831-Rhodomonas_salina.3